jgi:hypothetical protein
MSGPPRFPRIETHRHDKSVMFPIRKANVVAFAAKMQAVVGCNPFSFIHCSTADCLRLVAVEIPHPHWQGAS